MKLLLLSALATAVLAEKYTITATTRNVKHANSNGWFYALAVDYTGQSIDFGLLDNPKLNDFERGNTDVFEFESTIKFDKIGCLIFRAGNKSKDAWLIKSVSIKSDSDPKGFSGENGATTWLSSDTSTAGDKGHLALTWCAPPYPKI
jgi:hypothetical protein